VTSETRPAVTRFQEGHVETAGVVVRYLEAGQGLPLLHVTSAGTLAATAAHERLAAAFRVVVVETPAGAGALAALADQLGLEAFDLMASGDAVSVALELALTTPARVRAIVLEGPLAIGRRLQARLGEIAPPTLVLLGTEHDAATATARACQAAIRNGHLVLLYDAGVSPAAARPAAFVEVVTDFLERHEAFVISRARTVILP
jgi:pimeloyl-ACP methyl ester carboxylesterase